MRFTNLTLLFEAVPSYFAWHLLAMNATAQVLNVIYDGQSGLRGI